MSMVAEVIDAVVGGDTHRDIHALEMTAPTGATITTLQVDNDDSGYARVLAWIAEHALVYEGMTLLARAGTREAGG